MLADAAGVLHVTTKYSRICDFVGGHEGWRVAWACRRYFLSDLLELAGYEPGASSSVAITGIQTDVAQARVPAPPGSFCLVSNPFAALSSASYCQEHIKLRNSVKQGSVFGAEAHVGCWAAGT